MSGSEPSSAKRMNYRRLMVFKRFVLDLTTLSKCTDKHVACIITDAAGQQIYSIGINGGPKGGPDCLCHLDSTKYTCVHAEANALAKCTTNDPNKVVISSYSPCVTCASLMINSGVSILYYCGVYKSRTGLELLHAAGIKTVCIDIFSAPELVNRAMEMLDAGETIFVGDGAFCMALDNQAKYVRTRVDGNVYMYERRIDTDG